MRKSIALTTLTALTVGSLAFSTPASASNYTTTDIGSEQWWDANIPYRAAKTRTVNGQQSLYCPQGSGLEIAGAQRELIENGVRITYGSNSSRKAVKLPWVNGKTKRVKSGQPVCRLFAEQLKPSSVAELSTWTFADKPSLYGNVFIERPPLDTCTPAQLPTFVSPQLVGAQYVNSGGKLVYEYPEGTTNTSSVERDGTLTGFLDIRWTLEGGQGTYRYPTWEPNERGVMAETWKTTPLSPDSVTVVDSTLPVVTILTTTFGGEVISTAWQRDGIATGGITPLCGEEYLPSWSRGFVTDGQGSGGLSVEGDLTVGGTRANVVLNLNNSNVPTPVN